MRWFIGYRRRWGISQWENSSGKWDVKGLPFVVWHADVRTLAIRIPLTPYCLMTHRRTR